MSDTYYKKDNQNFHFLMPLIVLFLVSFILGFTGFQCYFFKNKEAYNWIRSVYRTISLYYHIEGDVEGCIPWNLQVARFLAPLITIATILLALMQIFREQWVGWKISKLKNHVIIIGLGTKGKIILEENMNKKRKILVIEKNRENANLENIRHSGCFFLIGDATNSNILEKANVDKTNSIFLLTGDDSTQIEMCIHIYQLTHNNADKKHPITCIMHLQKQELMNTLKKYKLGKDINDTFILKIFNIYENSARNYFNEYPPDENGITKTDEHYIQNIIFGFGMSGEALALQTALNGHYANNKKPHILIVDRLADEKVLDFHKRYPTYQDFCNIEYISTDINSPQMINLVLPYFDKDLSIATIFICFDNFTQNLLLALQLEKITNKESENIFVRTNEDHLDTFFQQNIKPYGLPEKVCSIDNFFSGNLDQRAIALHNEYLEQRKSFSDFGKNNSDVCWEKLPQEYQDSNRKSADHIGVKIRSIGCEIVQDSAMGKPAVFSAEEIEMLSELEHRRWCAERSLAGWTYGDIKNEKTRKTPHLVSWNNLPEEIKNYDRITVKMIPDVLAREKLKIIRK